MATKESDKLYLDKIPFNGRSLDEYLAIFDLDLASLKDRAVLDVAGGPSSFSAEARKYCRYSLACDPSYGERADNLLKTGLNDIADIKEKIEPVLGLYKWDFYKSPDRLKVIRVEVLKRFIVDYSNHLSKVKYIKGELPRLPFADKSFDLVLCGHFLFLFSDKLGYDFHLESIKELARVCADELRIFPLVGLDTTPYDRMDELLDDLGKAGLTIEIRQVAFEFQRGANRTLIIKR